MSSSDLVPSAASFAARAHRGQLRKDGVTPYFAHPTRVCLAIATIFGVHDVEILAAALLHDTIEDTNTDYDDLQSRFGPRVAQLVKAMTKDKRLPDLEREAEYVRQICDGGRDVQILKLGDIYDNLSDAGTIPFSKRQQVIDRAKFYLERIQLELAPEAKLAYTLVQQRLLLVTSS